MRLALLLLLALLLPAAASRAQAAAPTLVSSTASGGIAGLSTRVVVRTDGRATRKQRRSGTDRFRLDRAELALLRKAIARADLPHLRTSYGPPRDVVISDGITQSVRAGGRTVTVSTGATGVPAGLRALLGRLAGLG